MSEDELDAIRKKYLSSMQADPSAATSVDSSADAQRQAQMEAIRQGILRSILTEGAKLRLANLKLVKPERAEAIENQLIQLHQMGRLRGQVTEEQLRAILRQMNSGKRESRIEFRRS